MHVECAHGVAIVGSDKDSERQRVVFLKSFNNAEAIYLGHLNVEENQVGLLAQDRCNRRSAVTTLGNDLQVGIFLQQAAQASAGESFVIAKQYSNRHDRS